MRVLGPFFILQNKVPLKGDSILCVMSNSMENPVLVDFLKMSFEFCSILDDFNANERDPIIHRKLHCEH